MTLSSSSSIFDDRAVGENQPALVLDRRDQPVEILERMERRLPRIAQRRRVLEALQRNALDPLDRGAGLARRVVFLVVLLARLLRLHAQRRKQERIEPPEIAGDVVRA